MPRGLFGLRNLPTSHHSIKTNMADDGEEDGLEEGDFEDGFDGDYIAEIINLDSESSSDDIDSAGIFVVGPLLCECSQLLRCQPSHCSFSLRAPNMSLKFYPSKIMRPRDSLGKLSTEYPSSPTR